MIRVSDAIRQHALECAGVHKPLNFPPYEELLSSEWSPRFERMMRNRLIFGSMRYTRFGDIRKGFPHRENLPGFRKKIELYFRSGNAEFLVDIANYAMILFEYPEHPSHYLTASDRIDAEHTYESDYCAIIEEKT